MSKPNVPDFFIVGAPKCGTTALAKYLSDHPGIFITNPKEPHYYLHPLDKGRRRKILETGHYYSLFKPAASSQIKGEASVRYLYSDHARTAIKAEYPNAKIIIMKRNPVDFVASYHSQQVYSGLQPVTDLERAWHDAKVRAINLSKSSIELNEEWGLMYAELMLHEKYARKWIETFGESQVLLLDQEKMVRATREVYLTALSFLGLPDDSRSEFERVNSNKVPKSRILHSFLRFLQRQEKLIEFLAWLKARLGVGTFGIYKSLQVINRRPSSRADVSELLRADILKVYDERSES